MTYFLFDLLSWFPIDLLVQAILGLHLGTVSHVHYISSILTSLLIIVTSLLIIFN